MVWITFQPFVQEELYYMRRLECLADLLIYQVCKVRRMKPYIGIAVQVTLPRSPQEITGGTSVFCTIGYFIVIKEYSYSLFP